MKVLLLTLAFALAVAHAEPICQAKSNGLQSNRLQRRAVAPEGFCGVFEGKPIHCAPTDCCSQFGFCGNTADHCGTGCQAAFGKKCVPPPAGGEVLPPDGFCGVFQGKTIKCASSTCCSQFGFCGDTAQHCGTGCQSAFGKCTPPVVLPARTVPLPANAPEAKIHETCTTPGMLALTLDDGHSIEYNQIFLTYLKKEHVVATFFINGINGNWDISKNPEFVKRTYDAGHQIAHHTNTHADLAKLNDAELVSELCNLDMGIAAALGGITPRYIRFPYLSYSSRALKIAAFYGYTVVGTNLDTQDWDVTVKPSQLEYALKTYRDAFAKSSVKTNSFISLQHEILGFTANTLMKKLLPELDNVLLDRQQKPYDTVTVGKCIDKGSKPGDWYRKNIWHRDLKKDPKFYCPSLV